MHQFRHSAAAHLGDQQVPLQLSMAKIRHKSPRTAMRYVQTRRRGGSRGHRPAQSAPAQPLSPAATFAAGRSFSSPGFPGGVTWAREISQGHGGRLESWLIQPDQRGPEER